MRIGVLSGLFLCLVGFTTDQNSKISISSPEDWRVDHSIKAGKPEFNLLPKPGDTDSGIENFKLQQENNSVLLTWETSGHDEILFFEVERSLDNDKFVQIGLVSSIPSTHNGKFSYYDRTLFYGDKSYYRLKVKENHGATSTSNVIEWETGRLEPLELSFNSAAEFLTVKLPAPFTDGVLVIKSSQGRVLLSEHIENQHKNNHVILVSDLPAGLAMVCLEQENQIWSKLILIYN